VLRSLSYNAFAGGCNMPVSDVNIHRSAQLWLQRHCSEAVAKAREMVEEMRKKGDSDGADVWLRVIVAIGTLGELPTDTHHQKKRARLSNDAMPM